MTPGWNTTRPRTFTTAAAAKVSGTIGRATRRIAAILVIAGATSPAENGGFPTAWAAVVVVAAVVVAVPTVAAPEPVRALAQRAG